jgi:hypothetical protein
LLLLSCSLVGEWSGAWVYLSGFEMIEYLVDGFIICDDSDDFHLCTACVAMKSNVEDALEELLPLSSPSGGRWGPMWTLNPE